MEYRIIEVRDFMYFQDYVNKALDEGWILQGGVCVYWDGDSTNYVQALTKKKA